MSEWKEYNLGEICDITSSRRIFLNEYVKDGVPFYRSKEIIEKAKGNNISTELFITKERFNEIKEKNFIPVENDILITSVGTLGVSYLVSKNDFFYFKDGNLTWLRNYSKVVNPKYLLYWLRSNIAKEKFNEISIGSTQPAITIQGLKGLLLKLPKYSTQTAIAEILSSLDDKIELNNKINQELESLAQTLFKQWFIDFEFPNENGEPYKSSGGEMVDSELGEIPKGWEVSEIGLVTKLSAGGDKPKKVSNTPTEELNIPIYSNGITNDGLYGYTNDAKIFEESVTISARGTIGFICLRTTPFVPIVRLISVIAGENYLSTKFLYMWLKNQIIVGNGTTQQQLTVPDFKGSKIIIPAKSLVNEFTNQMNLIIDNINFNKKENKELIVLRDTLLPKLISGELKINENND